MTRKMAVAWKNSARFTLCPQRSQAAASSAASRAPSRAPMIIAPEPSLRDTAMVMKAISMPSRVIISSVKANTPAQAPHAPRPGRCTADSSRSPISARRWRAARSM